MQQSMLAGASVLTASSVKANTSTKNNAATFHLIMQYMMACLKKVQAKIF